MRKKIKSRLSSNHAFQFWLIIIFLFVCAVFHSFVFYNNFYNAFSKMNEEPIATITYKYKTAQRKILGRNAWDRLRQSSPIYNGDTIHTSELSEATIHFIDGNIIDLTENTMAQFFMSKETGVTVSLNGGAVVFDASGSEKGIVVKKDGLEIKSDAIAENIVTVDEIDFEENAVGVVNSRITFFSPTQNQKILYHTENKYNVEFKWSAYTVASDETEVNLLISTDKKFKNIVEEKPLALSQGENGLCEVELSANTYYWKIDGMKNFTPSGKFQVIQALPPKLITPVEDYSYSYKKRNPSVRLIWEEVPSASSYLLEISADENFSNPIVSQRNTTTSFMISSLSSGKYFWRVTPYFSINKIGYAATSAISSFRIEESFTADKIESTKNFQQAAGEIEHHTIEPVNGYKVSENLLVDTRFTWKKNLPENFESKIEIATDSNFKKIVYSQDAIGASTTVKSLPVGTYFWRLKSTGGKEVLTTPAKQFSVVGNLDAAKITYPIDRAVSRESAPVEFKWDAVQDADYYKFAIYSADGKTLMYSDTVYENRAELNMFHNEEFEDTNYYRMQVQAFAMEVTGISSRRTGTLSKKVFSYRKLRPIDVLYPYEGEIIDGTEAILNPITATWSSVEDVSEAQFVLSRIDGNVVTDVIRYPSNSAFETGNKIAPNKIKLDTADGLRPGKYQIVVYAKTSDGIDISNTSAQYKRTFTISPIPKLPSPQKLKITPERFDVNYLRQESNKKSITFTWEKVAAATEYKIAIYKNGKRILEKMISETNFEIDFMSLDETEREEFSRGNFVFEVQAIRKYDTDGDGIPDKILQDGEIVTSAFVADVPVPKKAQATGAVNPYGQ